jgi:hypothetical protein
MNCSIILLAIYLAIGCFLEKLAMEWLHVVALLALYPLQNTMALIYRFFVGEDHITNAKMSLGVLGGVLGTICVFFGWNTSFLVAPANASVELLPVSAILALATALSSSSAAESLKKINICPSLHAFLVSLLHLIFIL